MPPLIELGTNTGTTVPDIERVAGVLKKLTKGILETTSATATFGNKGKLMSATIKGIDADGNIFTKTIDRVNGKLRILSVSATEAVSNLKKLKIAQDLLNKQNTIDVNERSAQKLRPHLVSGLQGANNPGAASEAELRRFNAPANALLGRVAAGKNTSAELQALFAKMNAGATTFTFKEQQIIELFKQAQAAANNFGTAAQNATNRAARSSTSLTSGAQAANNLLAGQKQAAVQKAQFNTPDVKAAQALATGSFGAQIGSAQPKQILAFNASMQRAIALLAAGKVSLAEFAATLNNVKSGNLQTALSPNLNSLQNSLNGANNAFKKVGDEGVSAGRRIFLSWQNVIRIFESQLLYSAFSRFTQGLKESIAQAAEYSRSVALIQTISQDAGVSTNEWSDGIRKVSDNLGTPIADVAAAAYDALSNQVTKGKDSFGFLNTAIQFARTTNSSAEDSVNLLSSAINSYGLSATDAARVSQTFFTTIDLGRVKAGELANSFGRTGTLAHTLGVGLEETQAAISSMTRQGIKANEAYTLLNNVFLKLIKPTDALQGFLKKLGFESGQSLIAAKGFTGVLRLLDAEFDGSTDKAAEFFDEIRGARGILNLTGKGLQEFTNDLDKIRNPGDTFDIAKQLVGESEGQKLKQELEKLKNLFITEFGGNFLRGINRLSDAMGGMTDKIRLVTQALQAAVLIGTAFYGTQKAVLLIGALGAVNESVKGITLSYAGLKAAIAAANAATLAQYATVLGIGAAVGAGLALAWDYYQRYDERVRAASAERLAFETENAQKTADIENEFQDRKHQKSLEELQKTEQEALDSIAKKRAAYTQLADDIAEAYKDAKESIAATFEGLKSIVSRAIGDTESKITKATDNIRDARKQLIDVAHDRRSDVFDFKLGRARETYQRLNLIKERIVELKKQARFSLLNEKDLPTFNKIQGEIDRVIDKAQNLPNGDNVRFQLRNKLQLDRARDLRAFTVLQAKDRQEDERKLAKQQEAKKVAEERFKELQKFTILNKDGSTKKEFQGPEGRAKALSEFSDKGQALLDALSAAEVGIPAKVATAAVIAEQQAKIAKQLADAQGILGQQVGNQQILDNLTAEEKAIKETIAGVKTELDGLSLKLKTVTEDSFKLLASIKALSGDLGSAFDGAINGIFPDFNGKAEEFKSLLANITALVQRSAGTPSGDELIAGRFREVDQQLDQPNPLVGGKGTVGDQIAIPADKNDPNSQPQTIREVVQALKLKTQELSLQRQQLAGITAAYGQAQGAVQGVATAEERIKTAASGLGGAIRSELEIANGAALNVQRTMNTLASTIERLKGEAAALQASVGGTAKAVSTKPVGKHFGGKIGYFSDGGSLSDFLGGKFARGSDRIPAMLSRGEYVVNSRQTRQFLPLLRAINSGQLKNAPGTSTSIGDINITVQGGSSSESTVKGIASGLRRELRRGTIKI